MNLNNIILIGFMGCGKTSIARALSKRLGYYFIDTDVLIENYEGKEIVKIFAKHGEGYFRDLERLTFTWMKGSLLNSVVATGGGFVKSVSELSPLGKVVFIDLSLEEVKKRLDIKETDKRPLAKSEDLKQLFQSRYRLYKDAADIIIDADEKGIEEILDEIEAAL